MELIDIPTRTPILILGSPRFYRRAFSDNLKDRFELFYFDHLAFSVQPNLKESAYGNLGEIFTKIESCQGKWTGEAYVIWSQILCLVLCG